MGAPKWCCVSNVPQTQQGECRGGGEKRGYAGLHTTQCLNSTGSACPVALGHRGCIRAGDAQRTSLGSPGQVLPLYQRRQMFTPGLKQGCHSEFGSNKVRKMVRQGKEKRLLARIFKILGKARKRLSRQNSTIKVRKCEEKRPEFTKKARKRLSRQNSTRKVRKCEEK